ncbi:hypothetical protein Rhopal_005296-T1 [Rhodotorula paludigena]|uniref:Uncharacterized protein n=1 Tax=Rhodotorula paludigena TaxID=86838 RepID=A0AAV5GHY0_9BASI|nr:hypothetical protein Rhopal_005296-T1 [Rhodotorula paludigena]
MDTAEKSLRHTTREKIKPRADKALLINAGRLHGRRENREIDELNATVEQLEAQLKDARADAASALANSSGKNENKSLKSMQKEIEARDKKIRRLEDERDAAVSARDALTSKLAAVEANLSSDARLVELNRELRQTRDRASQLQGKLQVVTEESEAYQTRLRQIEDGAETSAEGAMNRQKKEYTDKVVKLEDKVQRLEADKVNLAGQVKTAKLRQDQLEELKAAYERDNERMSKDAQDAEALSRQAEKSLADARALSAAHEGGCSADEKNRLTEKIASLESLCSSLEKSATSDAKVRRYHDLLLNLRLSEDDVSTLLTEGADWPPVRAEMRTASLIDLLWLLTDQQDEREDEQRILEAKLARAESEAARQKKRADAAIAAGHRAAQGDTSEAGRLGEQRQEMEEERNRLKREVEQAAADRARDKETIVQLESRISAFEANGASSD